MKLLPDRVTDIARRLGQSPDAVLLQLQRRGVPSAAGVVTLSPDDEAHLIRWARDGGAELPIGASETGPAPAPAPDVPAAPSETAAADVSDAITAEEGSPASSLPDPPPETPAPDVAVRIRALESAADAAQREVEQLREDLERAALRLDRATHRLSRANEQNGELRAAAEDARAEALAVRRELRTAKQALHEARASAEELRAALERRERSLESAKKRAETLRDELRALRERDAPVIPFGSNSEAVSAWLSGARRATGGPLPCQVATLIGTGPYPTFAIRALLTDCGISIVSAPSARADLLVVGESDWTELAIERQLAERDGQVLRVLSQPLLLAALAAGRDPFTTASREVLEAFGRDHPALTFLMDSELHWPEYEVPDVRGGLGPIPAVKESPLHRMGYRVGIDGLPVQSRRAILRQAFTGVIPHVESDAYMRHWGTPKSRRRLARMGTHLTWLARTRTDRAEKAAQDWAADLEWLGEQFYRPWMRFEWPSVDV